MSDLQTVLAHIDDDRLRHWLTETVDTYGPTWAEAPALEVFEDMLNALELAYRKQAVDEERYNLIVEVGPQPPALMWVGHVDTVALYDEEHRGVRIEGDDLYGLGSADMKSGCVAAVEALAAVVKSRVALKHGLRLALVVGEEEYGDGSEKLIEGATAPLVVIGEPTNLQPCTSHYGYFEVFLKSRGSRAHAAVPEVGDNAIHAMLAWLTRILEAMPNEPWAYEAAVTPRKIDGGTPLFAVAEWCEAVIDVHLPATVDFERVQELLQKTGDATRDDHHGCTLEFEVAYASPGFANGQDFSALERGFLSVGMPWAPVAFRSHSDAALFHAKGMATVVCGPGRLEVAHRPDEHVSLTQLGQAARLYAAMFLQTGLGEKT